jgi:hypothetical protein
MANIQNLREKTTKATEKVQKCRKTIENHQKQLDKKLSALTKLGVDIDNMEASKRNADGTSSELSWEIYEVERKMDDIKNATRKLKDAEQILENWTAKLDIEVEKEKFLEGNAPKVIKDFLEAWKVSAFDWHVQRLIAYRAYSKQLDAEEKQARIDVGITGGSMPSKYQREALEKLGLDWKSVSSKKASFGGAVVLKMVTMKEAERLVWLEKVLEEDKKFKMLDLINRINAVVGTITDATYLTISDAGNLNGIIIGEKDKAKIETIGAGGYAIQCFHYRTLVNPIK